MSQVRALLGAPSATATAVRATRRFRQGGSGREDSNLRPPAPKAGALPGCATPRAKRRRGVLNSRDPRKRGTARSPPAHRRFEHRTERDDGAPAMAEAVLLRGGKLRQSQPRRLRRQEQGGVPEPVRSPRRESDGAVDPPFRAEDPPIRRTERRRAEEVRASAFCRHRGKLAQEPRAPRFVRRGIPRAVEPGCASERIDAEPAVIAERPGSGARRRRPRLQLRVLSKRVPGLFGRGQPHLGEGAQSQIEPAQQLAQLDELARIPRRDDEDHPRPGRSAAAAWSSAARCSTCSSRAPFWAIATIVKSCSGLKAFFSAVPCTSSSSPAALATTLKSTSAAKSSS